MPTHAANRQALAEHIAMVLFDALPEEHKGNVGVIWRLHDESPDFRREAVRVTGRAPKDPSDETWNLALSLLLQRIYGWRDGRRPAA